MRRVAVPAVVLAIALGSPAWSAPVAFEIAGGATGTVQGDSILWNSPAYVGTAGTIACTGPNCGLIAMIEGAEYPWEPTFSVLSNTTAAPRLQLIQWDLDPSHTTIIASSTAVSRWSNVESLGNRHSATFSFGTTSLGIPLCESDNDCGWYDPPPWPDEAPKPALATLVILGIGALALRTRRVGSR